MQEIMTILTPTYNRSHLLQRLYESLVEQSSKNFSWLIIDDGSEDDTGSIVDGFLKEKIIPIQYIRKKNGGKHTALNMGIAQITTELTFIVDSDDHLPKNAVETILLYHQKYRDRQRLCGYSFLRCYENGQVNTAFFVKDEEISTYRDVRINGNIGGDKAEVFFTDVLRRYPFPEFENEKFLPEDAIWMQMSGPYQMVHINQCIYISEYLDGGLTKSGRTMKKSSPHGMMYRSKVYLEDPSVCFKVKLKMMMLYIVYGKFAGMSRSDMKETITDRLLYSLLFIPATIVYLKWK